MAEPTTLVHSFSCPHQQTALPSPTEERPGLAYLCTGPGTGPVRVPGLLLVVTATLLLGLLPRWAGASTEAGFGPAAACVPRFQEEGKGHRQ